MNDFTRCSKCKEYHWDNENCLPVYFVYHEDYLGDEPREIRASDHEDAAIKYATYYNESGDYSLMNNDIDVVVEYQGIKKKFNVCASPAIDYHAKEN